VRAHAAEERDDDGRELVGWALDPTLRHDRPLSAAATRRALALALGLDEAQLEHIGADALTTALRRLRGIVAQCDRLSSAAAVDDLTGALRRNAGIGALTREIARAERTGDNGIVVAFIDVDGLKETNDNDGHAAGDALLRDVVTSIRERVRAYDLVFRYGGDEFVCALLDVTREQAERTIAEILHNVRSRTGGRTFSVGFAEVVDGDSAEAVLQRADAALYQHRRQAQQGRRAVS
jgi:diguanylate cyclase (GGDEF)-like protein